MMRLLFLCLLLLPAATAVSDEMEGSADSDVDDEDLITQSVNPGIYGQRDSDSPADKTTGVEEKSDQFTLIVIIVAVSVLTLSIALIVTIFLVRRHMRIQQQGIYFVPTEQDQKAAV